MNSIYIYPTHPLLKKKHDIVSHANMFFKCVIHILVVIFLWSYMYIVLNTINSQGLKLKEKHIMVFCKTEEL